MMDVDSNQTMCFPFEGQVISLLDDHHFYSVCLVEDDHAGLVGLFKELNSYAPIKGTNLIDPYKPHAMGHMHSQVSYKLQQILLIREHNALFQ